MTTLMSTILLPQVALCRLIAEADLNFVNFDSRNNNQHVSAHSLTQKYSVLYDTSGKFVNGRLGRYDVSLGYEWLAFDTSIKSTTAPPENLGGGKGHFLYNGEVVIDPKEIPFRLTLHSRDMNREIFSKDILTGIPSGINVPSDVTTAIYGGTRIDSGATLVMGVKNGMTNGYNEVLRHFPMLMLDYRDSLNKDRNSFFPVDNRLTRLAFVSLNKKDNWFHYRYVTFDDKIDASNNYNETQVQLGTVDYLMARRWVDFSNWLNLSVDGLFTKRMQARLEENYEEFSLNIFGTARRQSWEMRTFNNLTRLNENNLNRISYITSLPVYANGIISPTANWSAYTKYNDSHTDKGAYFTTVSGGYSIDSFRRSSFALSQGSSVEQVTDSDSSEVLILTGNAVTTSSPMFSRDLSLKAAYNIRNLRSNNAGNASNFTDQEIDGNASYNLTNRLRITAGQTNRLTTGKSLYVSGTLPGSIVNSSQYQSPYADSSLSRSSYQSTTNLAISWIPKPRMNADLSVSEDIYTTDTGERSTIARVAATVGYTGDKLKIASKTSYYARDAKKSESSQNLESTNSANYIFSRNLDAKVGFTYFRMFGVNNQINAISAEQSLNYNYYRVNGITRKLFEINETVTHEESFTSVDGLVDYTSATATQGYGSIKKRTNAFLLGAKYYPLRQMMIAGGARYSFVNSFENEIINYYGSLSVQFKLLDASLDYTYGKNKTDNRTEKRLSANVKKRF